MKNKLPNINSNNGHFIDGNPATGTLGTIVTAEWLNGVQERVQDVFEELRNVLLLGNLQPDGQRQNQVAEAIKAYCNNINLKVQSNTRNFDNYIPNSKKSNAVDSNSADMVATSYAVKTAYDKGVEARTAVDNLDSVAYKVNKSHNYEGNATALMQENTIFSTTDGNLLGLPPTAYKWGAGVSMSTNGGKALLYVAHAGSQVWAKGGYGEEYSQPWKRLDGADWSEIRNNPLSIVHDILHYSGAYYSVIARDGQHAGFEVVRRGNHGNFTTRFEPMPDKRIKFWIQDSHDLFLPAKGGTVALEHEVVRRVGNHHDIQLSWRDDGLNLRVDVTELGKIPTVNEVVRKSGDEMRGDLSIRASDWSGLNLHNLSGKYFRIETNPDHASHFASFIYRNATGANETVIYVPKKIGTMALIEDFSYQKIGNFEIRKYPDGTMYQTYWYDENDLKVWTQKEFTWAISFTETPQIFTSVTTSVNYSHDCGVNVLSSSNNSKVLYHYYEHGNPNQGLCRIQFLGIGRWK